MLSPVRYLKHPVLKETAWLGLVQGMVIVIGFANSVILARFLGVQKLGDYQLLLAWLAVASVCGLPGLNMVVLKSTLKDYDSFYWVALRKSLIFSGIGTSIVSALGAVLYLKQGQSELAIFLLLVAASIPLSGFQSYESALVGKRDFRSSRLLALAGSLLSFFLTCIAAVATQEVGLVYGAFLLSRLIVVVAGLLLVRNKLADSEKNSQFESELISQGWRQTALAVFSLLAMRLDRIVLGGMDPVLLSYYHVGTLIPAQVKNNAKIVLGILSSYWGRKNENENLRALKTHGVKLWLIGLLSVFVMWVGLPILIPLFFGAEYRESVLIGVIYSAGLLSAFWTNMIGMESQLQGDGVFNQRSQVIKYVVFAFCVLTIGRLGICWMAVSNVIAEIFLTLWSYLYLKRKLHMNK